MVYGKLHLFVFSACIFNVLHTFYIVLICCSDSMNVLVLIYNYSTIVLRGNASKVVPMSELVLSWRICSDGMSENTEF